MTTLAAPVGALPVDDGVLPLLRRAALRYLPLLFLVYIVAIIDRVNVGFAKLQMQQALQFSDVVYGLGAGIFFVGYFLFEIPSNMLLARIGARKWIARILILWGPIAAGIAFVETPLQFYLLRFLLGVGEAGLFPGVVLLLTYWFPAERRTRYIATFMLGMPIAGILIGPLSAAIITGLHGVGGLAGWQWMFIVQGLPALLLGLVVLAWLDDKPATARWLTAAEKARLQRAVGDADVIPLPWRQELKLAFTQQGLWPIIAGYLFLAGAANIFGLWGPQFLQDILATDVKGISTTFAVIFLVATLAMAGIGALADHEGRRETILLVLLATGAAAFFAAAFTGQAAVAVVAIGVGVVCYMACFPVFWGSITPRLAPAAAAAAIALINSVGNLGGAIGPALVGPIKQHLGLAPSIATLGAFMLLAALLLARLRRR
ncbi:MAG: MFS transporter [Burkholderiales bacterium]|nr:MFS transporter [Burkholderiales bacterium]